MEDAVEIWGGFECTVVRIRDGFRDQLRETGHWDRIEDLDRVAQLGITAVRYPVLWEQAAPESLDAPVWDWHDCRLERIRKLGLRPIVTLLHHGSGPRYTSLLDPDLAAKLARYAAMVAARYPWIEDFTPVNEPLTTARFSCLYGHWYPHRSDEPSFLGALFNEIIATKAAMEAIRGITPQARLIQTEDLGKVHATPTLQYQADYENERRWLSFDLLCGRVSRENPWYERFRAAGVSSELLDSLADDPCPPDIIGINHYLSSDRFLDQRLNRYPPASAGGNGRHRYADVEAVRIARADVSAGFGARLREAWHRYARPLALTEVHNGCTREEQVRWLLDVHRDVEAVRAEGVDVRALTVWALMGSVDWHCLLTRQEGRYETGAFDAQSDPPRPTALAHAVRALAAGRRYDHPLADAPGWWRRPDRFYPAHARTAANALSGRKVIITGATGTLGAAFARISEARGLNHALTSRVELDVADPSSVAAALDRIRPWAVINTAGYVRVADAEREPARCLRENSEGAAILARACAERGIQLLTFSSDLVFDGQLGREYVETDAPCPTTVYGQSKALAEQRVLEACPQALIVRTSAFFGPWDRYNFIHQTLTEIAQGRPVRATTTRRVSPTYVPHLVHRAFDLLIDGEVGIWHLANAAAVSWAELARRAAERAGLNTRLVLPHATEAPATNTALGSLRGTLLPSLDHALDQYFLERTAA